jgi:hypothetical protein
MAGVVLAGGLGLTACEDVSVDPTRTEYQLTAVNGESLPAVMFDGETEFGHLVATAQSGRLILREVTYTQRVVVDLVLDGIPFEGDEIETTGQYSVDGQLLTFDPDTEGQPSFTGTLQGGVLQTVENDPEFGQLTLTWQR